LLLFSPKSSIRSTTVHSSFADFFLMQELVRTHQIGQISYLVFSVYSGGNQPVTSSIEKRPHRYLADFGRDSPAICRPWEGFIHKFDFEPVLPASKTSAVCNLPVLKDFNREPPAIMFFAVLVP
jgi:hypothetical protein